MADGSVLTLTHHSPWRIVTEDGSEIILGDDWQWGDFGIFTVTPGTLETNAPIVGDRKPIDQNLSQSGVHIGYDALGNVITDPNQTQANRVDTLYDSAGNDRLQGKGGNDLLDAKRGDGDILFGRDGDDFLAGRRVLNNASDAPLNVGSILSAHVSRLARRLLVNPQSKRPAPRQMAA